MPDASEVMAAIVSKLSPSAQLRRSEITKELRAVVIESLDISISEVRRLLAEGENCADALTSYLLVKQQTETQGIRNLTSVGVMGLVLEAGKVDDARQHFSTEAEVRKKDLQDRIVALGAEDLELMEHELWRLGLETSGQEGQIYTEVSFGLRALREQMQTQSDWVEKPSGLVAMVVEVATSFAKDEVQRKSRGN